MNWVPDLPELSTHNFISKDFDMDEIKWYESEFPEERYARTIAFVEKHLEPGSTILDLGINNPLSEKLRSIGYEVHNTSSSDLDMNYDEVLTTSHQTLTAFEILEHMVSPFPLLRAATANQLFASVPLRLWFSTEYRGQMDPFDQHYHEFEQWQFDWLLEKAGWHIIDKISWAHSPGLPMGLRPILRKFTPRYYLVYAKRLKP